MKGTCRLNITSLLRLYSMCFQGGEFQYFLSFVFLFLFGRMVIGY